MMWRDATRYLVSYVSRLCSGLTFSAIRLCHLSFSLCSLFLFIYFFWYCLFVPSTVPFSQSEFTLSLHVRTSTCSQAFFLELTTLEEVTTLFQNVRNHKSSNSAFENLKPYPHCCENRTNWRENNYSVGNSYPQSGPLRRRKHTLSTFQQPFISWCNVTLCTNGILLRHPCDNLKNSHSTDRQTDSSIGVGRNEKTRLR